MKVKLSLRTVCTQDCSVVHQRILSSVALSDKEATVRSPEMFSFYFPELVLKLIHSHNRISADFWQTRHLSCDVPDLDSNSGEQSVGERSVERSEKEIRAKLKSGKKHRRGLFTAVFTEVQIH